LKEYKVIYKQYSLEPPIDQQIGSAPNGGETSDLNDTLNNHAREGWIVRNSGVIENTSVAERVIFWVLMEKDGKEILPSA